MNNDDIMRMASEAGGISINYSGRWMFYAADVERFAALVAANEREVCARLCEEHKALRLSEIVRARGEK